MIDEESIETPGLEVVSMSHTPAISRSLNARHITMIAIGGTVGTGLFIGVAQTLRTGPVTALVAYFFISTICYSVVQSFGEMVVHLPVNGSLCQFNNRFLSPNFGSSIGLLYWFSWSMTFALELSIVAQLLTYWQPKIDIGWWIMVVWTLLTIVNLLPIRFYGEIEFGVSVLKVAAIIMWLCYATYLVSHESIGFKYWENPGMWGDGIIYSDSNLPLARSLAWLSSLVNAAFTFQLIESIAITSGDTENPSKNIPRAIKTLFFRIIVFYIVTLFLLGLLIPYNDQHLVQHPTGGDLDLYINSSPFVVALSLHSNIPNITNIFNLVITVTIISAANSNIYLGSRCLLALAETNVLPSAIANQIEKTSRFGGPYVAVLVTSIFGVLAFSVKFNSGTVVFQWFLNICASAGLIMWACICASHIRFMSAISLDQTFTRDMLVFKGAYMPYAAWYALGCICVILILNGFQVFFNFCWQDFLASYLSLIIFAVLWGWFQYYNGGPLLIPLDQIDLWTGSDKIHLE